MTLTLLFTNLFVKFNPKIKTEKKYSNYSLFFLNFINSFSFASVNYKPCKYDLSNNFLNFLSIRIVSFV